MSKLLTTKQAAELLNIHPTTIHRMIQRGELEAYRVGGSVRIDETHLHAYLEANRITATTHRVTLRRQAPPPAQAYPWLTNAS